ncbi:MAG: acyl-CoA dehydrogenase, partial [Caulobacteraceae bacterium]|nr:acyl-CoA dehydrogenase [Caulobacteraceae bacterium]
HGHPDAAVRQKGGDYMGLLTPVLKGYLTDRGFKVCVDGMQVHGGSGFTEHFPASQYLRDCRIALIYEGTNGVQALDLVGRKLAANGGRAVMSFFAEIDGFIEAGSADPALAPFLDGLAGAKAQLQDATMWLMQNGLANPDNAGAASTDYMHLFGITGLAFMWAQIARACLARAASGDHDPFYANKLVVGRYFLERILPETGAHLTKLKTGSATLMSLPAEAF